MHDLIKSRSVYEAYSLILNHFILHRPRLGWLETAAAAFLFIGWQQQQQRLPQPGFRGD